MRVDDVDLLSEHSHLLPLSEEPLERHLSRAEEHQRVSVVDVDDQHLLEQVVYEIFVHVAVPVLRRVYLELVHRLCVVLRAAQVHISHQHERLSLVHSLLETRRVVCLLVGNVLSFVERHIEKIEGEVHARRNDVAF